MKKRIPPIMLLILLLVSCLAGCGRDGGSGDRDLGHLLNIIAEIQAEDEDYTPAHNIRHFKIKNRVAMYEELSARDVELEDYLGEVYAKKARALSMAENPECEDCRLYRVDGETNQLYLIKEDAQGELSLWKFSEFATDFTGDRGEALKEAYREFFPSADMGEADKKELRKLILGTGHDLLVSTTADETVSFQATNHLNHLLSGIGEGRKILGYAAPEQAQLKAGSPYTVYSFDGDGLLKRDDVYACPVLFDEAVVGLVSLTYDETGGRYNCSLAISYSSALEELRFSEALDFDKGIVVAQVEDKVIATDGERVVLLEDKINPGRPSVSLERLEELAGDIYSQAAPDFAAITKGLGK